MLTCPNCKLNESACVRIRMSRHQGIYYLRESDVNLDLAALHDSPSLSNSSGNSKGALSDVSSKSQNDRRKCPRYCYFYYAIVAAFGSLGFGFTIVYSSPFLEDMSRRTNFTLWNEGFEDCVHQSLVGPLAPIGGVVGGLLSSLVIGLFGLVFSLITAGVMFVVGWAMIGASWFVSSPASFRMLILTGRFVTGAATGWVSVTSPVSIILHIYPSIYLILYLSSYLPTYTYYLYLSIYLSMYRSIYLSI